MMDTLVQATITPWECLACPGGHMWGNIDPPAADDVGDWCECSCCGLQHQLQDGERLIGDDVLFSAEWKGD